MYINKLTITKNHHTLTKGTTYKLKPITIIVGDQGTGKSTLLKGIARQHDFIKITLTPKGKAGVNTYYYDSEQMNPRMQDPSMLEHTIGYTSAIASRFQSHGEVLQQYTIDCLKPVKSCIIMQDEPESGLSLRNQNNLVKLIKEKTTCQFIIVTHSLAIIQSFDEVLSLDDKKWVSSSDYINKSLI
jgi:predicted ATPase